jgi:hypothetical protein
VENQPPDVPPVESEKQEPESTRAFFKNLFSWFDKATKWKRFRNTRWYIKRGERLFDLSADELSKLKVMGPWTFNVYETVVAAIPAQMLAKIVNFFFPYDPPPPQIPESLSLYQKALFRDINKLAPSVDNFFRPFLVPTLLLAISSIIGWACLRKEDSTRQSRKRSRNAYLYFDGTYGLMPQTIISLAITMLVLSTQRNVDTTVVYLIPIGLLIIVFIYQLYLIYRKIPELLFEVNDYSTASVTTLKSKGSAPWTKYVLSVILLAGPISWIILIGFFLLQVLVLYSLATFRIWLRGPT